MREEQDKIRKIIKSQNRCFCITNFMKTYKKVRTFILFVTWLLICCLERKLQKQTLNKCSKRVLTNYFINNQRKTMQRHIYNDAFEMKHNLIQIKVLKQQTHSKSMNKRKRR